MSRPKGIHWSAGAALAACGAVVAIVIASGAGAARIRHNDHCDHHGRFASQNHTTADTQHTGRRPDADRGQKRQLDGNRPNQVRLPVPSLRRQAAIASPAGSTTQKVYKLSANDVGNTIRVRVSATNSAGDATATVRTDRGDHQGVNAATARRQRLPFRNRYDPSRAALSTGPADRRSPRRLPGRDRSVDPAAASPVPRFRLQRTRRPGRPGLRHGRPVPAVLRPPETATGSNGWAVMNMTQLRGFPAAQNQQLLVIFVRARKPGWEPPRRRLTPAHLIPRRPQSLRI